MDAPYNRFKIFLVDDDVFSLNITEQHIRNLGHSEVQSFSGGKDCLNALHHKPNVVFLDHNMDELSGIEVLKEIKRHNPNIYVVMLSGKDGKLNVDEFFKYGAFDFITKGDQEHVHIAHVLNRIHEVQTMLRQSKSLF